ncbi:hypothetical protein [Endozoicomonas arenosclerae]|uniref:hypothetical protein n=1 Tax=Endozoicomonas arenosclerae TaxID=1633495 RepID=UPI0007821F7C|nr:hypothetical protein [Endozoicomonas arenosclerae]
MGLGNTAPTMAVGNSMGDYQMLGYLSDSVPEGGLSMVINHDDPVRECAYEDEELLEKAREKGWLVISMKNDFKRLFSTGVKRLKGSCQSRKRSLTETVIRD